MNKGGVQCLGTRLWQSIAVLKTVIHQVSWSLKNHHWAFYQMQQMGLLLGQKVHHTILKNILDKICSASVMAEALQYYKTSAMSHRPFHYCDWDPSSSPKLFSFSVPCLSCIEGPKFCFAMRTICYLTYDNITIINNNFKFIEMNEFLKVYYIILFDHVGNWH